MTTSRLTLDLANKLIVAAFEKGRELKLQPLTIAVLDAGGHLVAFQRQDGSSIMRPQIATGKAYSALAIGISSRKIAAMAAERPTFVAALSPVATHGIIPAAGGVLIAGADGTAIGAVGITGDTSDNDEACALAGIKAIGCSAVN